MAKRKPGYLKATVDIGPYETIDPPSGLPVRKPRPCPNHCWHDTGVLLASMPPQLEMVCCRCGLKKNVTIERRRPGRGHGPYEPGVGF